MKVMKTLGMTGGILGAFCATVAIGAVYQVDVGGGGDYTTVQAAVDAAVAAADGEHTIRIIDSSSYNEAVSFSGATASDHLIVEAQSGQSPKVYGFYHNTANQLTLRNLTMDGSLGLSSLNGGLYARGTGNVSVESATFQNPSGWTQNSAIYAREGSGTTLVITNVTFQSLGTAYGVHRRDSESLGDVVIHGCTFDSSAGIMDDRDNNTGSFDIRFNLFNASSSYSYYHDSSVTPPDSTVTIEHNTFYNIGDDTWEGLRVRNATDFGAHLENNLFYGKRGVQMWTDNPTAIDADYNGFCNMVSVGYWNSGARTLADLNAFAGSSNNVENAADPFIDATNGDFHLKPGSWAATAASDGGYVGAFGVGGGSVFFLR